MSIVARNLSSNFLEEDTSLHIESNIGDLKLALKNLPPKGDVQKDSGKKSFYTVDKLGHTMFYLDISSYNKETAGEREYVMEKIRELRVSCVDKLKEIDNVPKFEELKKVKISEKNKHMTAAEKNR